MKLFFDKKSNSFLVRESERKIRLISVSRKINRNFYITVSSFFLPSLVRIFYVVKHINRAEDSALFLTSRLVGTHTTLGRLLKLSCGWEAAPATRRILEIFIDYSIIFNWKSFLSNCTLFRLDFTENANY